MKEKVDQCREGHVSLFVPLSTCLASVGILFVFIFELTLQEERSENETGTPLSDPTI